MPRHCEQGRRGADRAQREDDEGLREMRHSEWVSREIKAQKLGIAPSKPTRRIRRKPEPQPLLILAVLLEGE